MLADRGVVPPEALAAIRERARFDVARIDAIEKDVQHDVIAFVSNVAENVGPEGRWLHYGLTSSDVVDTALALLMRDAWTSSGTTSTPCWRRCGTGRRSTSTRP